MDSIATILFGWVLNLPLISENSDIRAFNCIEGDGYGIMWITITLLVASLLAVVLYYHVLCKNVNKATISTLFWTLIITFVVLVIANSVLITWLPYSDFVSDEDSKGVLLSGTFWMLQLVSLVYYALLVELFAWLLKFDSAGKYHMPHNIIIR